MSHPSSAVHPGPSSNLDIYNTCQSIQGSAVYTSNDRSSCRRGGGKKREEFLGGRVYTQDRTAVVGQTDSRHANPITRGTDTSVE